MGCSNSIPEVNAVPETTKSVDRTFRLLQKNFYVSKQFIERFAFLGNV